MNQRDRIPKRRLMQWLLPGLLLSLSTAVTATELPGRHVDIGTHQLYIDCRGQGSPTVIIDAGMGGFSLEWRHVQTRLAKQVRVCSYDRAGYGHSESGPLPRTSARIARELHQLLTKAEVPGPYLLVGHSFGGYNIRHFAHDYPEDTMGLVLIDASHPSQFKRFPRKNLPAAFLDKDRPQRMVTRPIMPENYPAELRREAFLQMASYKARRAQGSEFRHFRTSAEQVRQLALPDVPILVLSRGRQVWPDTTYGDRMERIWTDLQSELGNLSDRTLHLIAANSGHSIHFDQPDAVSNAVLLTATAAESNWYNWEYITSDSGLTAPILKRSLRIARR